ncbi:hypothetical protein MCFN_00315 [Mycoplasmopsis californica]|uniref:ECF transporter S component n=1 Tax=Mycoplasmopsis californica TaxID=2113 RepID=A0A059XVJ5_9BACT|nr:ECF transporter S component [Mycoplasmopsis californica]AIA29242.1 hypothetical protein MCFN_00315 [Mycoplasmopsis californica]
MEYRGPDDDFRSFSKWSIRKITFIAILIAISVAFFLIVFQLMPIVSLPAYKISIIGLPIKITGFIFGPVIGAFVGLVSDLFSFALVPTYYNFYFTIAAMLDGIIPGMISWVFLRLIRFLFGGKFRDTLITEKIERILKKIDKLSLDAVDNQKNIRKLENKVISLYVAQNSKHKLAKRTSVLMNINMFACISILVTVIMLVTYIVGYKVDNVTIQKGIVPNRIALIIMMVSGYLAMLVFILIARFKLNSKLYLIIVPIVVFSALIELFNVPILSFAEKQSIETSNSEGSLFVYMFQHIVLSPVKIWGNMFIIFFTYKIIAPSIYKNRNITY